MSATLPKGRLSVIHWVGIVVGAISVLLLIVGKPPANAPPVTSVKVPAPAVEKASFSKLQQPSKPSWEEMDRINARLEQHNPSDLSTIPARGYKNGVAGVFKDYRLHANVNSEIFFRGAAIPEKGFPIGYYFSIYVTRKNSSGRYDELDGIHAQWFRAEGQSTFVPWNSWAQHISDHDSWLDPGGPIDDAKMHN